MSKYQFLVQYGTVSGHRFRKANEIARKHGAVFVQIRWPEKPRVWFSAPSKGAPFDADLRDTIRADLEAAKLWPLVGRSSDGYTTNLDSREL